MTVIFPSGLGVREGAVGAFMLALAPDSAVVGAVVLNRLAITIVEALLLAVAAGLSRAAGPRILPRNDVRGARARAAQAAQRA